METSKKVVTNVTNETKKETVKKADLSALFKLAENFKVSESSQTSTDREIYKNVSHLSSVEKRKYRQKQRKALDNLVHSFKVSAKNKNENKILSIFAEFKKMYSEKYLINDYSLQSIRTRISNEQDKIDYQLFIDTMKVLAQN